MIIFVYLSSDKCRDDNNLIYVGSTVQPLYKRWHQHKRDNNNNNNGKQYNNIKMRELGIEIFYTELYQNIKCGCVEELLKHDGEMIINIGNLNKRIEGRPDKENRSENKEKIKQYLNEYYETKKSFIDVASEATPQGRRLIRAVMKQ